VFIDSNCKNLNIAEFYSGSNSNFLGIYIIKTPAVGGDYPLRTSWEGVLWGVDIRTFCYHLKLFKNDFSKIMCVRMDKGVWGKMDKVVIKYLAILCVRLLWASPLKIITHVYSELLSVCHYYQSESTISTPTLPKRTQMLPRTNHICKVAGFAFRKREDYWKFCTLMMLHSLSRINAVFSCILYERCSGKEFDSRPAG